MSERTEQATEENDGIQQLLKYAIEITSSGGGSITGAALGSLFGGPIGALIGGASGKGLEIVLSKVGQEIWERQLSQREKVRIGTVLAVVVTEIRQRIKRGESVRTDGFFDEKQAGRSDAEEVAESVLLKVQREPEEKKIQYMGYLLSSIAFDPEISAHVAHQLSKAAEQLTYRQLCILKLCVVKDDFGMLHGNYRGQSNLTRELYSIVHECHDLYRRGMIDFGARDALGLYDVSPISMTIHELGSDLFNLMELTLIPDEDIVPLAEQLKSSTLEINTF